MPIRLLPRPSTGWRNSRKAQTNSISGSSRDIQPKVPLTIAEHQVREPALEAPPGEGGDEDAEGEVEQGGAVAAVRGVEVADVVADPADAGAHHVADPQPGPGHHPHQPGLPRFDGGQLPGARGSLGAAGLGRSCAGAPA